MLITALPYPGGIASGLQLRTQALKAINVIEAQADLYPNGKAPQAPALSAFFLACKAAVDAKMDTVVPTVTVRAISAARPSEVKLTISELLDATVVPANTAFTLASPAKTVTSVVISGTTVTLTVNTPYVAGDTAPTVAYAVPPANSLRDLSGNAVAAFGASAVTRIA